MTRAGRAAAIAAEPQLMNAVSTPCSSAAGSAMATSSEPASGTPPASACAAAAAAACTAAQHAKGTGTCQCGGSRAARSNRAIASTVIVLQAENVSVSAPSSEAASTAGGAGAWRDAAASHGSVTTLVLHGSSVPTPNAKKQADST
jgi:hypothetical protein